MKVLGGRRDSSWDRFDRLQRTAGLVLGRPVCPPGVHRFSSHAALDAWKASLHAPPSAPTSSPSAGR